MDQLAELIAIAVKVCSKCQVSISIATCVGAFLVGVMAVALQHFALRKEKWASYFGWAFLVLFTIYAGNLGDVIRRALETDVEGAPLTVTSPWLWWLRAIGSGLNNLLFLGAGALYCSASRFVRGGRL